MKKIRIAVLAAAALACAAAVAAGVASAAQKSAQKAACPHGHVNFGVEPYDAGAKFTGAYKALTTVLSHNLGCPVKLLVTNNYTAEVEAMRANKLDVAEFGPLGYIFAHKLSHAKILAVFGTQQHKPVTYTAAIWVPNGSQIKNVAGLKGHTLALSDPASTSGNLYPRYAMLQAHLNPDKDVQIKYSGGHPQSLLALTNGQVDAAEVNSQQQATAVAAGTFDTAKYHVLWRSKPIPNDPITVRSNLPLAFQTAVKKALLKMRVGQLKLVDTELGVDSGPLIPAKDTLFGDIRNLVKLEGLKIKDIG
jgi:phosphonate transport system substrate-binding protein